MLVFRWQQAAMCEVVHKPKHLTCMMMHVLCQPQINTLILVPCVDNKGAGSGTLNLFTNILPTPKKESSTAQVISPNC